MIDSYLQTDLDKIKMIYSTDGILSLSEISKNLYVIYRIPSNHRIEFEAFCEQEIMLFRKIFLGLIDVNISVFT